MQRFLELGLRRWRRYLRRTRLLAHLVEARETRWPDLAIPHDPSLAKTNRLSALLGDAGAVLAATASIYLLIALLVGILTRSA